MPTPPVLIVQAVHDQLISVEDIDELTDTYKSGGASVTYHRDMFSEHLLLHPLSAPMTLRWLTDRFNGQATVRTHGADEVADAAEPDDLCGDGAAGEDRRQGHDGADGRALSAVSGGPNSGSSTGGQAPRSSRAVDAASSA